MQTVLIVGGGIIGLSTALELAFTGAQVTVLERGKVMQEASWAAAGMLAAHDPENPPALTPLSEFSLSLYPDFLDRIEHLSGLTVPIRTRSTLQLHPPAASPFSITPEEALQRVPGLHPGLTGPFLWLEEQSLDPRDLCQALPEAVRAAGVTLREDCPVTAIRSSTQFVRASTPSGHFHADVLISCCGAWSHLLPHPTQPLPRKGQMISMRLSSGAPPLTAVLRSPDIYLVPRGDGRIIIGATVEDAGYDRTILASSSDWLLDQASALWPPLGQAAFESAWTGIRPASPDHLPLLGPINPRIWIATGHYRNGILLAPGTARILAASLQSDLNIASLDLTPFLPTRFQPSPEAAQDLLASLPT